MVTKGWSFNGGVNGEEEEENGNVRERKELSEIFFWLSEEREHLLVKKKRLFSFLIILFKLCHMSPFEWSQKRPTFLLM